jgi:hypothetical protein
MFKNIVAVALLALAACAARSSYDAIGTRLIDQDYRAISFVHKSEKGDMPVKLYVKAYPLDGKLALCGYYVANGQPLQTALLDYQLSSWDSTLALGPDEVSDMRFLVRYPSAPGSDATAKCIQTVRPWDDKYRTARIIYHYPGGWVPG